MMEIIRHYVSDSQIMSLSLTSFLLLLILCWIFFIFFNSHLFLSQIRSRERREKTERSGTMESVSAEQSATVDELVEACIQAFGELSPNCPHLK